LGSSAAERSFWLVSVGFGWTDPSWLLLDERMIDELMMASGVKCISKASSFSDIAKFTLTM
jgi:hypothetical protein